MNKLTRDETFEPVLRDQIFRLERGQGNIHFPCSADHEKYWQPYSVDPCSAIKICDYHARAVRHFMRSEAILPVVLQRSITAYTPLLNCFSLYTRSITSELRTSNLVTFLVAYEWYNDLSSMIYA